MAFVKKTWKDRIVQYANRRLLTKSGGEVEQVTVTRDEGTISEAGDQFNASNMNDLEQRVNDGFDDLNAKNLPITSGSATNTKDYIDNGLSDKQATLSNQAITLTPNASVLGSNFTGACYQYGKVVCLFVQTASPTSEVAYQSIFLTGLPKPVYANANSRVSLIDRATNKPYRFRITDSGQLQEWYNSSGKIPSGADLYGTIVYIAE